MGRWVTIKEACEALNVSDDTIRRRIRDELIPARKESSPTGTRWLVEIPDADTADAEPTERVEAADALPTHSEVVAAMQKIIDNLEREREELAGQLRTREREVAELHVLLQTAQTHTKALPPPQEYAPAPQEPMRSVSTAEAVPTQSTNGHKKGFWGRLFSAT